MSAPLQTTTLRLPYAARMAAVLVVLGILVAGIALARDLILPLGYAVLLAVLLAPVNAFLVRLGIPRLLSISLAVVTAVLVVLAVVFLIGVQIAEFSEELPRLKEQGGRSLEQLQAGIQKTFGISSAQQLRWISRGAQAASQGGGGFLSSMLLTFMDVITLIVLVPLYTFLFLYYDRLLITFLVRIFSTSDGVSVPVILDEIGAVINRYVVGLLMETLIIAVLNSLALSLLGVKYAILFGVIAAVLNLIPYAGIIIGSIPPVLMALVSAQSPWLPFGVIGSFVVIQFLDNNLIVPWVVASRISVNAIASIIAVIAGGMLAGVSGMFLALPAVAILKIIFDRVEHLQPWGMVLGVKVEGAKTRSDHPVRSGSRTRQSP